jgi:hypothetical protein
MPRLRATPFVATAVALSLSIVSSAPAQQAAVTPQQPTVPWEAFRVDLATGALIPLESTKARKEKRGRDVYCYVEGAQSPMTIRSHEPLVFVFRYDGSPKNAEVLRKSKRAWYKGLEFVSVSDTARRYATGKYVPVDVEPYGEVVSGVNPKDQKEVGQAFVVKPQGPLAPGEYALTLGGMAAGSYPDPGCTALAVSAFRIVEGGP